jgi:MFS family permease
VSIAVAQNESTTFRWDRLTVASALAYCALAAAVSVGVVLGELRQQFHLSGTVTALHGSTFGVGMLVAGSFGNQVVARFGRPRVFWGACTGAIVGVCIFCLGPVVAVTLFGAVVSGFSAAAIVMVQPGLLADHHGENRSAAFAATNAYPPLCGMTLGLVIGATISARGSWRMTFILFALSLLAVLFVVGRGASIPPAVVQHVEPAWRLLRDRQVRRAWRDVAMAVMVDFPIGVWATVYLKEVGHSSAGLAPILGSVFGLSLFVSRLLIPRIAPVVGPALREWCLAATGFGAVLLWLVPSLGAKVAVLAVLGFTAGPVYTASVDRLYAAAPHVDSSSLGALASLASGTAVTTAPLALGVVADIVGLRLAILIVPAIATATLVVGRAQPAPRFDR